MWSGRAASLIVALPLVALGIQGFGFGKAVGGDLALFPLTAALPPSLPPPKCAQKQRL